VEALPGHQAAGRLQHRPDDLLGGAGVRRRLEDDELPGVQVLGHGADGCPDRGQVGAALDAQRRRHADHDGVSVGEDGRVGGRAEPALDHRGDVGVVEVVDVRAAGVEAVDHAVVHVEPHDAESGAGRLLGERQADVAEADHDQVGGRAGGWGGAHRVSPRIAV
jgi:hypothetical protein